MSQQNVTSPTCSPRRPPVDNIYLVGSEDVRNAGQAMSSAAAEILRAANLISQALYDHQRFLDDWLERFKTKETTDAK